MRHPTSELTSNNYNFTPLYVTKSAKTGLICTKYTYSFYHIYFFFCVSYTISVSFIEFLRKLCVYDEIFDKVLCQLGKRVIKFERLKIRSNFMCR